MNAKAAYAHRAVTLRKIKRVKGRLIKFQSYLNTVIEEINKIEIEHKERKTNAKCYKCYSKH